MTQAELDHIKGVISKLSELKTAIDEIQFELLATAMVGTKEKVEVLSKSLTDKK